MALTRGANSKFPCPVYLVRKAEMCKGAEYPLCTTKTMQEVYNTAKKAGTAEASENLLKGVGLRGVEVCKIQT